MVLCQTNFLIVLTVIVELVALPYSQHQYTSSEYKSTDVIARHGRQTHCNRRLIKRTDLKASFCTHEKIGQLFPRDNISWLNPCSGIRYTSAGTAVKSFVDLTPLKSQLRSMLRPKYRSCRNIDNSTTNWCDKKNQYSFLEWSQRTDKLCLSLEHKRLQVYIATLSFLSQLTKNIELTYLTESAKVLQCEIETVIEQRKCGSTPKALSPKEMCLRLNLDSIEHEDHTVVDIGFVKAKFGRYLLGFERTLRPFKNLQMCKSSEEIISGFSSKLMSTVGSEDIMTRSWVVHLRTPRRKYKRRQSIQHRL